MEEKTVRVTIIFRIFGYNFGLISGPSCWHIVDDGVYGISLSGVRQSPINIETAGSVVETDESLDELKYEYVPENCTQVGNTGASWKVDVNPEGSSINTNLNPSELLTSECHQV